MNVKIGLETHVQLNSRSKLFCGCANPAILEKEPEPNTLTCPTCLGLPGSKPRTNEAVIAKAMQVALALGCTVPAEMFFSRKTYFYPDMSKNFQITQYETPLGEGGSLEIVGTLIRLRRIHIEEDPSRLVHAGRTVLADYNRAGVPLIEIVTEPDFTSPKDARLYLQKLALLLEYLGVYHPSSRAVIKSDANISMDGGARVEVKNITGTREIEKALSYEIVRQSSLLRRGQRTERGTRSWNPERGITQEMRGKEGEEEYGYISEPDLTVIDIPRPLLKTVKKQLPELPDHRLKRFLKVYGLSPAIAASLISDSDLANLFESVAVTIEPRLAASWIAGYLKKTLNYNDIEFRESGIQEKDIVWLLGLFRTGEITDRNAELAIRKMVEEKEHAEAVVKKCHLLAKGTDIRKLVKCILAKNANAVEDFRSGEQKALNFLVGAGMRAGGGRVDANTLRKELLKQMKKSS